MNITEMQSIVSRGESKTVEYKSTIAALEKLGQTLSGMLNTDGGYGFIGIADSGKIIGTEVNDSTRKKLTAFCNDFDPSPDLKIDYVQIPNTDKYVIVFICKQVDEIGPITFKGRAYFKTESGVELMPSEKYKQLLMEHAGVSKSWETMNAVAYSIDDLDYSELLKTIKIGLAEGRIPEDEYTENIEDILKKFDLIHNGILNNAAIVLFAKKMPADYSQCFIRMGMFVDDTMDNVIDSRQIRGNAFQLLEEAQNFIKRHIPTSSRYDINQFERIDEAALPLLAVREGDISLLIFNDRLEIHNIGRLYAGISIEQLSQVHPSRRRNERIAQVFFARKLIDRWGGGTSRIIRLCHDNGLPKPLFTEEFDGVTVRLFFKEPIGATIIPTIKINLKEREKEILEILTKHEFTSFRMLVTQMHNPPADRTLRENLLHLKSCGIIDSQGKGRGAKWFVLRNYQKNKADNKAE
jgi:ATP-dependent DNA helicase RecG